MQKEIHPTYNEQVEAHCICWNEFYLNSAVEWPIKVESCPACHPTYTGKQETKVVKGRMEKFKEKQEKIKKIRGENN